MPQNYIFPLNNPLRPRTIFRLRGRGWATEKVLDLPREKGKTINYAFKKYPNIS